MAYREFTDAEDTPVTPKVTEKNIRGFAGLNNGLATDPDTQAAMAELKAAEDAHFGGKEVTAQTAPPSKKGYREYTDDTPAGYREYIDPDDDPDSLWNMAKGAGETALNVLTGGAGQVAGGLAGLATTPFGVDTAAKNVQDVGEMFTYAPRTEKGKKYSENVGDVLDKVTKLAQKGGQLAATAIPFLGEDLAKPENANELELIGNVIGEVGANFLPLDLGIRGAKKIASRPPILESADKLEALNTKVEPTVKPEAATDLPPVDMEGVPPVVQEGNPFAPVAETPLPELNMNDGQGAAGFPKLNEDIEAGGFEPQRPAPVQPDPLSPEARAMREQGDIEGRFQNQEDFNNPIDNGLTEQFAQAQRDFELQRAEMEQTSAKQAAFEMAEQQKQLDAVKMEAERQLAIAREAGELDYNTVLNQGDKSLMSRTDTAAMVGAIESGNLKGALGSIAKMHPDAGYRDLARYLESRVEGINTKLHLESAIQQGDRAVTGYHDVNTNTVGFSVKGAVSPHTVLHETVHALTTQFMAMNPNSGLSIGIRDMFRQAKASPALKDFYGVANQREFIAEAFSNPKFQEALKQINVKTPTGAIRNLWDRFVGGIKAILGIKDQNMGNMLDRTLDLGKQIMDSSDKAMRKAFADKAARAGIPKKIADFMVEQPKKDPVFVKQNEAVEVVAKRIPGLEGPISDFTFYDKPLPEIIEMARTAQDIPDTMLEKASHLLQSGGLMESLKTRNPTVKYTYERVTRAMQEAHNAIKTNVLDDKTGIKRFMREMTPTEKGEINSAMMLNEGQRVLSSSELAAAGFNEKQINYYNKYRELSANFFKSLNETREQLGLKPMDERVAHVAGRFMGDFSQMVFHEGKVIGRIAGATKWELQRASKFLKEQHPEYDFHPVEYQKMAAGKAAASRFGGLMEAINFMEKTDTNFAALMESYRDYLAKDSINYLNATRHAKAKVERAGGVIGSEGNKPWKDAVKNAEEGMKAQLSYFEQGYQWIAMEKAVNDIKQVVGDEGVVTQTPRAVQWANEYVNHALGQKQGWLSDASNNLLSAVGEATGIGHSNIIKASNTAKHLTLQKFMGFLNVPFTAVQLVQPFISNPALVQLLRNRGLEFSASRAQIEATGTMTRAMAIDLMGHNAKLDSFEKGAIDYAHEKGIFDVKMADHLRDINESKFKEGFNAVADANIKYPELLTRGTTFLFYSHLLKEAGIPAKDIFGAAENMTNFAMVNYAKYERAQVYSKLGWIGDLASALTTFKMNQLSQGAFYLREGVRADQGMKSIAPLATYVGTAVAVSGVMGVWGFQEADYLYSNFMKAFGKADSLTNQVLKSDMPEVLSHGLFASLGVDMTSRFSNANVIPDSAGEALMPYGSALVDMGSSAWDLAKNRDKTSAKRAVKAWAPSSVAGVVENQLFTDDSGLYVNPRTLEGRIRRTPEEQQLRNFGFKSTRESKELATNYSDKQIGMAHAEMRTKILDKAKRAYADGTLTPEKARDFAKEYAEHEGLDMAEGLQQFAKNRRTTELERAMLNGNIFQQKRAAER